MTTKLKPRDLSPTYLSREPLLDARTGKHLPFPIIVHNDKYKCLCVDCSPCVSGSEEEELQLAYVKAIEEAIAATEANQHRRRLIRRRRR